MRKTEQIAKAGAEMSFDDPLTALSAMVDQQIEATAALKATLPDIAQGGALMAKTIRNHGRLVYAAAGSSGLMALADALELHGTFGIPTDQIASLAGGFVPGQTALSGAGENDPGMGKDAARELSLEKEDLVICVSASGSTPYTLGVHEIARQNGATIIAIANNPDAPLFTGADVAIYLDCPSELVGGSTRMGAGSAQKATLNALSTLMALHLGHVFQGHMVNVVADNDKLRERARNAVVDLSNVNKETANDLLQATDFDLKTAIVMAHGADLAAARSLLNHHKGHLGPAIKAAASHPK